MKEGREPRFESEEMKVKPEGLFFTKRKLFFGATASEQKVFFALAKKGDPVRIVVASSKGKSRDCGVFNFIEHATIDGSSMVRVSSGREGESDEFYSAAQCSFIFEGEKYQAVAKEEIGVEREREKSRKDNAPGVWWRLAEVEARANIECMKCGALGHNERGCNAPVMPVYRFGGLERFLSELKVATSYDDSAGDMLVVHRGFSTPIGGTLEPGVYRVIDVQEKDAHKHASQPTTVYVTDRNGAHFCIDLSFAFAQNVLEKPALSKIKKDSSAASVKVGILEKKVQDLFDELAKDGLAVPDFYAHSTELRIHPVVGEAYRKFRELNKRFKSNPFKADSDIDALEYLYVEGTLLKERVFLSNKIVTIIQGVVERFEYDGFLISGLPVTLRNLFANENVEEAQALLANAHFRLSAEHFQNSASDATEVYEIVRRLLSLRHFLKSKNSYTASQTVDMYSALREMYLDTRRLAREVKQFI